MNLTVRIFFLSLFFSVTLTFVVSVLYVFYPVLWAMLGGMFRSVFSRTPESGGIAAVAGEICSIDEGVPGNVGFGIVVADTSLLKKSNNKRLQLTAR